MCYVFVVKHLMLIGALNFNLCNKKKMYIAKS